MGGMCGGGHGGALREMSTHARDPTVAGEPKQAMQQVLQQMLASFGAGITRSYLLMVDPVYRKMVSSKYPPFGLNSTTLGEGCTHSRGFPHATPKARMHLILLC